MLDLRYPTLEDAELLATAVRESLAELEPWMEWATSAYDVELARRWIRDQTGHRDAGTAFEFLIVDTAGEILGACGINRISPPPLRIANVGYWVRTAASGRGIAPEAAGRLVEWAFNNTNLVRLEIVTAVGNERSRRVAEKVGGYFEGVLRARLWTRGPQDARMYSVVRPEIPTA